MLLKTSFQECRGRENFYRVIFNHFSIVSQWAGTGELCSFLKPLLYFFELTTFCIVLSKDSVLAYVVSFSFKSAHGSRLCKYFGLKITTRALPKFKNHLRYARMKPVKNEIFIKAHVRLLISAGKIPKIQVTDRIMEFEYEPWLTRRHNYLRLENYATFIPTALRYSY